MTALNKARVNKTHVHLRICTSFCKLAGAPVARYVNSWPSDLAVPGSRSIGGGNLSNSNQDAIAHNLSLSPSYRPDMSEILVKGS